MELLSFMLGLGRGAMDGQRDVSPAPVIMRTKNMIYRQLKGVTTGISDYRNRFYIFIWHHRS